MRSTPHLLVVGACYACDKGFGFNPKRPPAIDLDGVARLVCEECMRSLNRLCVENGKRPFVVLPTSYEATEIADSELALNLSVGAGRVR